MQGMADRRELPPLDLLLGFEAAARHLSFTKAATELFLTQSAVSRQVQALEEALGVSLFQRRHRALLLTDEGQLLSRAVGSMLDELREVTRKVRGTGVPTPLSVTTIVSFASLWLIPRLPKFRAQHPSADVRISADNQIVNLTRERIDVAIRYCAPDAAPPGAVKLFGEEVMPMCSPALLREPKRPLKTPADLRHHVLLHDDWSPVQPWLDWNTWLQAHGAAGLKPASELRFSHYDQMIQAAVDGQGVALGRWPLLSGLIKRGQLVAPFEPKTLRGETPRTTRAFFVFCEPRAAGRAEVQAFVSWLIAEADSDCAAYASGPVSARTRARRPKRPA
jgi:LysR family transcriptional regulator, glycine cleavage system transcriptional activator